MYCLIGDGESSEGSIWEALHFASHYRLDNLVAVFDVNRLGQSDTAPLQHDMDTYQRRLTAFGYIILRSQRLFNSGFKISHFLVVYVEKTDNFVRSFVILLRVEIMPYSQVDCIAGS